MVSDQPVCLGLVAMELVAFKKHTDAYYLSTTGSMYSDNVHASLNIEAVFLASLIPAHTDMHF